MLAAVILLALAAPARAQLWSPSTGVPVCGDSCGTNYHRVTEDGKGGLYVAWTEYGDYPATDYDAYVQRLTGSGLIAPGWPVGGLALCALRKSQSPQAITLDGYGGAFVTWYDDRSVGPTFGTGFDTYVQRVLAGGTVAPNWPTNGMAASLAINGQFPEALVPDASGGCYVIWQDERDYPTQDFDVYVQHLTATGEVAEGWPADGLPLSTAPEAQGLISAIPDGAGGVVIVWADCQRCSGQIPDVDIYAQRLLPGGTIAPGWTAGGTLLVTSRGAPRVATDGAGGFYLATSTFAPFDFAEHWVDRFTVSGTRAPGWPAAGVRVCGAPGERHPPAIAPDGMGGLLLTWNDFRGPGPAVIFASRVLPGGGLAPGWAPDGVPVSQILGGQSTHSEVVADAAGGAYVCWEWSDYSSIRTEVRVQHLSAAGAVAPGWPMNGVPAATSLSQHWPRPVADGAGGVIVVWEEHGMIPRGGLFAQRFAADGPTPALLALASADATPERVLLTWQGPDAGSLAAVVYRRDAVNDWERMGAARHEGQDLLHFEDRAVTPGTRYAYRLGYVEEGAEQFTPETWVDVPQAVRFALRGPTPNPSAGDLTVAFSLAGDEPASLEVYDLSGRLVRRRDVGALGPGAHRIPIAEQDRLPAGIYALRLRQGNLVATARAVVIR